MKKILVALTLILSTPALATQIVVDKRTQTMYVDSPEGVFTWKVSTAKKGYHTPSGTFSVQSMEKMHYSRLYDNSPMPWSIFFNGNIAIHGTPHISGLGSPKSHGCVRLHPANAKTLYNIISKDENIKNNILFVVDIC